VVVVAVLLAVVLRTEVISSYSIPSPSMAPTLQVGDHVLVNQLDGPVHRGDIVVFARPPAEHCGTPVAHLVKRVIGLPGDRISSPGGTVEVDGRPLPQPWLPRPDPLGPSIRPQVVPARSYFVLGDNRAASCDSRYWGVVPAGDVVGKVVAITWPPSRWRWF
jgi:signal peptidase I